jgi:hypothetical protein
VSLGQLLKRSEVIVTLPAVRTQASDEVGVERTLRPLREPVLHALERKRWCMMSGGHESNDIAWLLFERLFQRCKLLLVGSLGKVRQVIQCEKVRGPMMLAIPKRDDRPRNLRLLREETIHLGCALGSLTVHRVRGELIEPQGQHSVVQRRNGEHIVRPGVPEEDLHDFHIETPFGGRHDFGHAVSDDVDTTDIKCKRFEGLALSSVQGIALARCCPVHLPLHEQNLRIRFSNELLERHLFRLFKVQLHGDFGGLDRCFRDVAPADLAHPEVCADVAVVNLVAFADFARDPRDVSVEPTELAPFNGTHINHHGFRIQGLRTQSVHLFFLDGFLDRLRLGCLGFGGFFFLATSGDEQERETYHN